MPSAELNGLEIHHEVHGEGDRLLCVHGLACERRADGAEQFNTAVTEFLAATPAEAVR